MKKRITAFFLSFIMVMSMFAQYVPGVSAKEIDPWENPGAYIGSIATFNSMGGEESLSSFHIVENPESYDYDVCWPDDTYWLYNESGEEGRDELPVDDMKMVITDCYDHEVSIEEGAVRFVWYKVEAAEGYELPEKMADKPYILYMTADDIEYGVPASLNFDLIEETEEATPVEMEETAEEAAEAAEELLGAVPAEKIDPWEDPEAYVGSTATFNTDELVDFHVFGNPESYDYNLCWEDNTYWIYNSETTDELPDDAMQMVITGYYDHEVLVAEDQTRRFVWYKVEAAEGYELPEKMADKPYVLYMTTDDYELAMPASLLFDLIDKPQEPVDDGKPELGEGYTIEEVGLKGYFSEDVVKFYREPEGTANTVDLNTAELPAFVDVTWMVTDTRFSKPEVWYVIKVDENWSDIADWLICYVPISHVTLVPAEVTELYEKLLGAATVDEYEEIMENADSELLEQLTEAHFAVLQDRYNTMVINETRTEVGTAVIGDVSVPVTVTGLIPEGTTVSVEPVSNATVMDGGFDIENEDEIVLALDIKVLDENGEEWQPKEGRQITVEIGMAELGYEDGKIFRLHHKHGDEIDVFEVFVVMDGKLTVTTNGFSLYVISDFNDFNENRPQNSTGVLWANPGNSEANATPISLTVGETVVFYANPRKNENQNANNLKSVWWVTDPEGAIFYEVYSSGNAGSYGVNAKWIRVTALKETESPIVLRYRYTDDIPNNYWNGNPTIYDQYYALSIVAPRAQTGVDEDDVKLYIKDEVNTTGLITATLVDTDGNEVAMGDGCTFSWERDDDAYIIPTAYEKGGKSINICVDHAGILEERRYNITYTVKATLENGREKEATYTVYYQSEVINSGFESPVAVDGTYTFFANGWKDLFWKTTSPGTGRYLSRDVEYARFNNNGQITGTTFYPSNAGDKKRQFAELNAENFGALYQDIITAPNEKMSWEFLHAKRGEAGAGEAMFIIMGPTEYAQKVTNYEQLSDLIDDILKANNGRESAMEILRAGGSVEFKIDEVSEKRYELWYHDANDSRNGSISKENAWRELSGSYVVPEGQYRTRLFFVTDPISGEAANYGNLIDSTKAGQYKKYLIEYYLETYDVVENSNVLKYQYLQGYDEGYSVINGEKVYEEAMIYSSVELHNFQTLETEKKYLLSTVYINGENSPYNIRYAGEEAKPRLFIENYAEKSTNATPPDEIQHNNYKDYDIVMQVFFRDTIVAVQKWVEFPKIGDTDQEALLTDQKKTLIDGLIEENGKGYQSFFDLDCATENCSVVADGEINITKNDPAGWYTGYIPIGENLDGQHKFTLTEERVSSIEGLEIDEVEFKYYRFENGVRTTAKTVNYTNVTTKKVDGVEKLVGDLKVDGQVLTGSPVACDDIMLDTESENKIKIAEIKVTNKYREKEVKINYVAVGKGTVDVQDGTTSPALQDSESFLYYSGKPKGVVATPTGNYKFAGWYLDEYCTQPVDESHGYVDYLDDEKTIARFTPNKNKTIDDDNLEVTYYAKFSIGSLQIIRENAEPGQVFVYKIEYTTNDDKKHEMYVTVVADEKGKGSTEIIDAPFDVTYTVTQLNDWSWRHKDTEYSYSIQKPHEMTEGLHGSMNMTTVFEFNDSPTEEYWLNGNSELEKNIYGG